jgi:hypothetical protein
MLFIVNHNPRHLDVPDHSLSELLAVLNGRGIDYRVWIGQYSAEAHLKHKLQVLQRIPVQVAAHTCSEAPQLL